MSQSGLANRWKPRVFRKSAYSSRAQSSSNLASSSLELAEEEGLLHRELVTRQCGFAATKKVSRAIKVELSFHHVPCVSSTKQTTSASATPIHSIRPPTISSVFQLLTYWCCFATLPCFSTPGFALRAILRYFIVWRDCERRCNTLASYRIVRQKLFATYANNTHYCSPALLLPLLFKMLPWVLEELRLQFGVLRFANRFRSVFVRFLDFIVVSIGSIRNGSLFELFFILTWIQVPESWMPNTKTKTYLL